MNMISQTELIDKLQNGNVYVDFTKSDNTLRTMLCTKRLENIPTQFHPKGTKIQKLDENGDVKNTNLITVFDIENSGWRSFNYTTITNIK